MLNEEQFTKFLPAKSNQPKKPASPRKLGSLGGSSYKFLPLVKSKEERDLMEAKAKAMNLKTQKAQTMD